MSTLTITSQGHHPLTMNETNSSLLDSIVMKVCFPLSGIKTAEFYKKYKKHLFGYANQFEEIRSKTLTIMNGITLKIDRADGATIDAVWRRSMNPTASTVILFHPNIAILDCMTREALFFKKLNLNVLMVTMGGYPGSAENTKTTEYTTHLDVAAAIDFVKNATKADEAKILAYGMSIGGSLALQAGKMGCHVITDQTFTTPEAIVDNILPFPINNLAKKIFNLDVINNSEKIKNIKGEWLGIYSADDQMMTRSDGLNLTHELALCYTENKQSVKQLDEHLVRIPGAHCSNFTNDLSARIRVRAFLQSIGFV